MNKYKLYYDKDIYEVLIDGFGALSRVTSFFDNVLRFISEEHKSSFPTLESQEKELEAVLEFFNSKDAEEQDEMLDLMQLGKVYDFILDRKV